MLILKLLPINYIVSIFLLNILNDLYALQNECSNYGEGKSKSWF